MKIAMIGHKRVPGREGGVEVVVEELSTRMVKAGHEVTLFNRKDKLHEQLKEYNGIKIINTFTISRKSLDAFVYSFISSMQVIFSKYEVIHYHALGPSVMLLIPHMFGKKTVVTVHGLNYKTPKWKGFGAFYIKLGEKITAKYADEIIVLSKEAQNYFLQRYNRKTNYIPNGVTIRSICRPKLIKEKFELEKDGYILYLSRIVPGKGLENLVKVYNSIPTEKKLVIAGESTFTDDFFLQIKQYANNNPKIVFTGFVSGKLLDELYSNAYLFVFPSEAEGMPLCLLEAMSYNCCCLVSNIPENLEVIKDYGYRFSVSSIDSLKNALKQLINENTEKPEINTREYIAENYNWDNTMEKTFEVYKSAIEVKK